MPKKITKSDTAFAAAAVPVPPLALSTVAVARTLGVSTKTVYRLIAAGTLKAKTWGRRTMVDAESVRAFYAALPDKVAS